MGGLLISHSQLVSVFCLAFTLKRFVSRRGLVLGSRGGLAGFDAEGPDD